MFFWESQASIQMVRRASAEKGIKFQVELYNLRLTNPPSVGPHNSSLILLGSIFPCCVDLEKQKHLLDASPNAYTFQLRE